MYKIRSIQFINHPTLKNLKLDFCGSDRTAVDTVILAGENGTGKSTILNYLYGLFSGKVLSESELVLENNGVPISLSFKYDNAHKTARFLCRLYFLRCAHAVALSVHRRPE